MDAANIELAEFTATSDILLNDTKKYIAADNFETAKLMLEALIIQYPNSSYAVEANRILVDLIEVQMNAKHTLLNK